MGKKCSFVYLISSPSWSNNLKIINKYFFYKSVRVSYSENESERKIKRTFRKSII